MEKLIGSILVLTGLCACTLNPPPPKQLSRESVQSFHAQKTSERQTLSSRETFNYVYIGDINTSVDDAKSSCLAGAQKKAKVFSQHKHTDTVITEQKVKYIDDIVTVRCQVKVLKVSQAED